MRRTKPDLTAELPAAGMMQAGIIKSHARKVLRVYAGRPLAVIRLLNERLQDWISYKPPGGLALRVRFRGSVEMDKLPDEARKQGLILSAGSLFAVSLEKVQGARLGFASMNEAELALAVERLRRALELIG